ncbi:LysR substrate-binding domain-containing protein [Motiliproteus sp. MSK22-1]|uniref:LysR substrate-binding domain-containing protein n=1 Tax=Motiliproteus sp. MSK22-1 TaxID=1897630 RepID=UPI000976C04D|nr:LysR substrate-binding domain-containing protein [Motiliproteus sp. MSK22-1]OMH25824.1 hypothetical protein BGP75_25220 [Motiliproteus sp. MSK22-1]
MNQANLSSELLRTFVTVIEADGFIRAAEHLHKTQSTISQHIKRLEQETGTELFIASGRRRVLTPSGEILLGYAKRMLSLQDAALFAVKQTSIEEAIRIGVSRDLSEGVLPQVLGRFSRTYPGVKLFVESASVTEIVKQYDRNEYDLTLTLEADPSSGQIIATEQMVWLGPENYEWSPNRPLPLASYPAPCYFRSCCISALDKAQIPWNIVYTSPDLLGLMAAVKAGLGVTVRAKNAISSGTEVLTPRLDLPELPSMQVVLRNRVSSEASEILADELSRATLKAA